MARVCVSESQGLQFSANPLPFSISLEQKMRAGGEAHRQKSTGRRSDKKKVSYPAEWEINDIHMWDFYKGRETAERTSVIDFCEM